MDQETQKLVDEQFKKLPVELQAAINTVPWKTSLKEIALANKIALEKQEILERETMFILYGFEKPEDYIGNLMREVEISEETAIAIAEAVEKKIFEEITLKTEASPEKMLETIPEVIHNSLPVIEPDFARETLAVKVGETVHDVPHVEPVKETETIIPINKPATPQPVAPQSSQSTQAEPAKVVVKPKETPKVGHYEAGKDPYREPIV